MAVLFTLVHRKKGLLATFETPAEAGQEMVRVVQQHEPEWLDDLRIERGEFVAATPDLEGSANKRS